MDEDAYVLYRAFEGDTDATENPYLALAALRRTSSVRVTEAGPPAPVNQTDVSRGTAATLTHAPATAVVLGFDEAQTVLRDTTTYSSSPYADLLGPVFGPTLLEMDGVEHHTHRALLQGAFSRSQLDRWATDVVRDVIAELLDGLEDDDEPDLVPRLTFPLPLRVIAGLLGLPRADLPLFQRDAVELFTGLVDFERGLAASCRLGEYLGSVVEDRREQRRADLVSTLVSSTVDGETLDDEAIVSFLQLLLVAGTETTFRSLGNALVALLQQPQLLSAMRTRRELIPAAIEEALRWESPLQSVVRVATAEAELGGVVVPKGAVVIVHLGAANRDERRWLDPDRFDPLRPLQPHLAFGSGAHHCLGLHLARLESRLALEALLTRYPGLRADDGRPPATIVGSTFRGPLALPVVLR